MLTVNLSCQIDLLLYNFSLGSLQFLFMHIQFEDWNRQRCLFTIVESPLPLCHFYYFGYNMIRSNELECQRWLGNLFLLLTLNLLAKGLQTVGSPGHISVRINKDCTLGMAPLTFEDASITLPILWELLPFTLCSLPQLVLCPREL
jgi:hypothetical protein